MDVKVESADASVNKLDYCNVSLTILCVYRFHWVRVNTFLYELDEKLQTLKYKNFLLIGHINIDHLTDSKEESRMFFT